MCNFAASLLRDDNSAIRVDNRRLSVSAARVEALSTGFVISIVILRGSWRFLRVDLTGRTLWTGTSAEDSDDDSDDDSFDSFASDSDENPPSVSSDARSESSDNSTLID